MTHKFWTQPFSLLLIISGLIIGGVGGFFFGRNTAPAKNVPNHIQQPNQVQSGAVVFFVKATSTNFYLKPLLYQLPEGGDSHQHALEALFSGPPPNSKLKGLFPKDTKILGLTIKNGIAYVNLNRRATQINVGSAGESLAVASIVNTLTKFPDVFRVKILIEGKEVESLAGHVDLTGLLKYNDQVVDPSFF